MNNDSTTIGDTLNIDWFNAGLSLSESKRTEYLIETSTQKNLEKLTLFMLGEATGKIKQYFENRDAHFKEIKKLSSFVLWNTKKKQMQKEENLRQIYDDFDELGSYEDILSNTKEWVTWMVGDCGVYAEYAMGVLLKRINNGSNGYAQITAQINAAKENMAIIGRELAQGYEGVDVYDEKAHLDFYAGKPLKESIDQLKRFSEETETVGKLVVVDSDKRYTYASMLLDKYVFGPVNEFRKKHQNEIDAHLIYRGIEQANSMKDMSL